MIFFILNITPIALAKTRRTYLTDFLFNNEIHGEGFKNGIEGTSPLTEATTYAIEILDHYGLNAHDLTDLETSLESDLQNMFNNDEVFLYDLYFLLKSLNILEYSIEEQLENQIYNYINQTEQIGGGFSFSNTSKLASISSTYFIVQIHSLIGKTIPNITIHKDWVLLCNNTDGGYGSNSSLSSTILDTYYAVSILEELGFINEIVDENQTLNYLNTFYVQNPSDTENFGGYMPDITANYALLSSTFYCAKAIEIIDDTMLQNTATIQWVLTRQIFQDGGFADITQGTDQLSSSVTSSYYAFKTLELYNSLSKLNSEAFMVEFNYWILVIIMASIGLIAGIGVVVWRKRRI
jgi:hypothetical protein